jgi:DNA-binding NtrC family response regulator
VASILVVGPDAALLEGVAQTLVGAGHQVQTAEDIPQALESLGENRPLLALVSCEELQGRGPMMQAIVSQGGAVLGFHCDDDDSRLPYRIKRNTLAELKLPLERQRLLALVKYVENRARAAGRDSVDQDSPPRPEMR